MSSRKVQEYYTIWRRVGVHWFPLRTYLILPHALGLARDWAIDGQQYRVTKATGEVVETIGKPPKQPRVPKPSDN